MTRLKLYWSLVFALIGLSCGNLQKAAMIYQPATLDSSFRSSTFNFRYSKKAKYVENLVEVFDYNSRSDSLLKTFHGDTTINFGFIFPHKSKVFSAEIRKMNFGNDSTSCEINYAEGEIFSEENQNSILTGIIFNPQKNVPGYDPYKTNTSLNNVKVFGKINNIPFYEHEIIFEFEHRVTREYYDSSMIQGYIKTYADSFHIKPLYHAFAKNEKHKDMVVLQGYSLFKGDELIAFLQHAPMVKWLFKRKLKDVLYISDKITNEERLIIAAYFSLVSRNVTTGYYDVPLY